MRLVERAQLIVKGVQYEVVLHVYGENDLKTSADLGATWSALVPVDASAGTHEFDPAITVDSGQNITKIAYYHNTDALHFKNRTQVLVKQIPAGSTTPGTAIVLTTVPDSPEGDANFGLAGGGLGDHLGIAAHGTGTLGGSTSYVAHTNNARLGVYFGLQNAESNNHVSKFTY